MQSKAACRAMAALFLANMHAPDFKPAIALTDLNNRHLIFWLDGFTIVYYAAPDAATAWTLTKAILKHEPDGSNDDETTGKLPVALEPIAKRQMLDVHGMRASGGMLTQLADLKSLLAVMNTNLAKQQSCSGSCLTFQPFLQWKGRHIQLLPTCMFEITLAIQLYRYRVLS